MSALFSFRPLVINPELAQRIGLNEAIVLQQLKYWLIETESGVDHDGKRWIYNTLEQWQKQFPFWSVDTVKRTLSSLHKQELVLVEKLARAKHDHTNYYTINYESPLIDQCKMPSSDEGKMPSPSGAGCTDLLTENTQETTAETTSRARRPAQLVELPDWVPVDAWDGFVEMRKSMGARGKLTERAARLIIRDLQKLVAEGHEARAVLEQSMINNWRGIFPVKAAARPGYSKQAQVEARNRQAAEDFVNDVMGGA